MLDDAAVQLVAEKIPGVSLQIERVPEGGSTDVYRIRRDDTCFYLRILPEAGASFAPEVRIHNLLCERGLCVPEVVYFEHFNATLERSLMITIEIAGVAVGYTTRPTNVREIVRQAGRELAVVNRVPVQGWGWIDRTDPQVEHLRAEYGTCDQWLTQHFDAPINALRRYPSLATGVVPLQRVMEDAVSLFDDQPTVLAHGDFDPTHIFHHNGQYTGIIDFGEIRGAPPLYDLGHFAIENNDLLPYLFEGYAEIVELPDDYEHRVRILALLIAARRVGRRILCSTIPYQADVSFITQMLRGCLKI